MIIHNNQEQYDMHATKIVQALDNTGIRTFMYFPQTKAITIPENTCAVYQCKPVYVNMPQSFADDYVHPDDHKVFNEMYYKIDCGEKTATAVFHSKDFNYCNHVTLTAVSWLDDGKPYEVFGLIENMSELYRNEQFVKELQAELACNSSDKETEDILKTIASAIGSQYNAVYYVWLEDHKYRCFQEKVKGVMALIDEEDDYKVATEMFISQFVIEKDRDAVRSFVDVDTLAQRLGDKNSISYDYRSDKYDWSRGQFIVGKRDENGKPLTVIYAVSDINAEMEAKREKHLAEQEALHDSLTGLWNRKAFDEYKEKKEFRTGKAGLILFDIDRFKEINDLYGHETGDRVIKAVSEQLANVLRQSDMVFRIGGDEFALLLQNCGENAWNSICRKIAQIHTNLKDEFDGEMHVTISAGICINEGGYIEEMYNLADRAMYNTKVKGRGGCTLIAMNGDIKKEWHDQGGFLRKGDVLERNSTVTWRIELPKKEGMPVRAYGDDLFLSFIGADNNESPEELYHMWREQVEPDYFDIIQASVKATIKDGKSEVLYMWRHPERGVLQLRCSLSLDSEMEDYYALIGYIHVTTGTHVFTLEDLGSKVKNALDELYFCSFYVRLSDYSFKVYKAQPYLMELLASSENAQDVIDNYIDNIVSDDFKTELRGFLNLTTLRERMKEKNIISIRYTDNESGWLSARFVAVDRNENGEVETVALVHEIDRE